MTFAETPTLIGRDAILEPLSQTHRDDLAAAVGVQELWRTWYTHIPSPDSMSDEIDRRLALQSEDRMAPWVVIDPTSDRAVGMTTYCNLNPPNRRLEIGST
ncbi:MAG: putative GNAT-family acetyltransferase [Glaciihabitans sp.]|nr:putative GNAT-family acetyltransferase [Glaciihabitans sp.]